jgi:6,7-dimethyl-8-ribityllumazine synthase
MASEGNNTLYKDIPQLKDVFITIIKTEWNADLTDKMEDDCIATLEKYGARHETLVVPGSVEIPFAIKNAKRADAYIAFGVVIRGETPHFDYVCNMVSNGILQLNLSGNAPVIFGVLTVNNKQQAIARIDGTHERKGAEAAISALKMIALKRL